MSSIHPSVSPSLSSPLPFFLNVFGFLLGWISCLLFWLLMYFLFSLFQSGLFLCLSSFRLFLFSFVLFCLFFFRSLLTFSHPVQFPFASMCLIFSPLFCVPNHHFFVLFPSVSHLSYFFFLSILFLHGLRRIFPPFYVTFFPLSLLFFILIYPFISFPFPSLSFFEHLNPLPSLHPLKK